MKTKQTFSMAVLVLAGLFQLNAQGIEFFHGSFDEALAKADAEGKIIFMDAYATWCGPCKWMAANTFPDPEAGRFFNREFINLKMDMERGEGPQLARKYGLRAYPTLFFFDPSGDVILQTTGARGVDGLLALGREALQKAGVTPGASMEGMAPAPVDPVGVAPGEANPNPAEMDPELMTETFPEEVQPDPAGNSLEAELFAEEEEVDREGQVFSEHSAQISDEDIEGSWDKALFIRDAAQFHAAGEALLASAHPQKDLLFVLGQRIRFEEFGDSEQFLGSLIYWHETYNSTDANAFAAAAEAFMIHNHGPELLDYAEIWAQRAVDLDPSRANNMLLHEVRMTSGKD